MIGLGTLTLDYDGDLLLHDLPTSKYSELSRRVVKTATLDGGVVVTDFGYADTDRNISVVVNSTQALYNQLRYLISNYGELSLSTKLGHNLAVIKNVSESNGKLTIQFELSA